MHVLYCGLVVTYLSATLSSDRQNKPLFKMTTQVGEDELVRAAQELSAFAGFIPAIPSTQGSEASSSGSTDRFLDAGRQLPEAQRGSSGSGDHAGRNPNCPA